MRLIVFFISLCSFLLGGGHDAVADTHENLVATSQHFEKYHHSNFGDSDQGFTLVEDADLDLTEDNPLGDEVKNISNKFVFGKYKLPQVWHSVQSQLADLPYDCKRFKTAAPFFTHTPIYIKQRVLRI